MAKKNKYSFDSKIHVYRATKRMSQQELADLVGVSRQTIIQLERNRYNPSIMKFCFAKCQKQNGLNREQLIHTFMIMYRFKFFILRFV